MLVRFADGQGATIDALRAAVASGDSAAAARHAHAIAGAAGNLGADGSSCVQPRRSSVRAARAARTSSHLLGDLEASAAVVFRSIDTLRQPIAAVAAELRASSVPATARGALDRLQTALGDFDVSAAGSALAELESVAMPGASRRGGSAPEARRQLRVRRGECPGDAAPRTDW